MRVIVNGLLALRRRTGVGSYVANLLDGLQRIAGADVVHAFPNGAMRLFARAASRTLGWRGAVPSSGGSQRLGMSQSLLTHSRELARRVGRAGFQLTCAAGRFDLYHEPNFVPHPTRLPTVVTIHDLSVLRFPEWHPADRVTMFEKHFLPRLQQCRHVLTVSEFVRAEVIRDLGLSPERVTGVPNGVRADLGPVPETECRPVLQRLGLPPTYLLHVGTIEPRKNILTLLRAYCELPAALRDRCPLVLVGAWGWKQHEVAAFFHDTARHRNVRYLGFVADEDMAAIYSAARALLFPTYYEGFGLPPLEMMACGGAVIVSTADAVQEVVGDRGFLIDPNDVEGWRDAMARVIAEDDWRSELARGAVERASEFSWDLCARTTMAVYHRICNSTHRNDRVVAERRGFEFDSAFVRDKSVAA